MKKFYYNEKNQLHREDGPACEYAHGTKCWYLNGKLHREDGPAIERADGTKKWFLNDEELSENEWKQKVAELNGSTPSQNRDKQSMPSTDQTNQTNQPKETDMNNQGASKGFHHCKTDEDGNKFYYNEKNQLHREDGPACEYAHGTKCWYLNGKLHRENGPAIEFVDHSKYWYLNGKYHRTNGPAVEYANGTKKWYLNGKLHRTNGPAIEWSDGTKEWYLNGEELSEDEWRQKVAELNGSTPSENRDKQSMPSTNQTNQASQAKETTMNKSNSIMDTIKSDAKLAGKRSAARKINKVAIELIVSFLSQGKNKRQINGIRNSIVSMLETSEGKAAFGVMLGFVLPQISKQLPEKYHPLLNEFSQEFRVEGMSVVSDMVIELATGPAFQMAKGLLTTELDTLLNDSSEPSEKVRIDTRMENHEAENVSLMEVNAPIFSRKAR